MKTSAPPSTSAYLRNLHAKIIAVRQKRAVVKMTTGIASALGLLIGVITLEALLDEAVDLPWLARAFILLSTLAGSGFLLWRDSIKPFLKRPNDDAVALMVEHALPVFKTRFIASIQLSRAFAKETPPQLVRALLAETSSTVLKTDFSTVVKTARLKRSILIGIAVTRNSCRAGVVRWRGECAAAQACIPLHHPSSSKDPDPDRHWGPKNRHRRGLQDRCHCLRRDTAEGQGHFHHGFGAGAGI